MKTIFLIVGIFCFIFAIYVNLKGDQLTGILSGFAAIVLFALCLL